MAGAGRLPFSGTAPRPPIIAPVHATCLIKDPDDRLPDTLAQLQSQLRRAQHRIAEDHDKAIQMVKVQISSLLEEARVLREKLKDGPTGEAWKVNMPQRRGSATGFLEALRE